MSKLAHAAAVLYMFQILGMTRVGALGKPMSMSRQKLSGAFFTPQPLVEALACWAVREATDRLLDPSCGDGRFIAAHEASVGIEQDPQSAQAAIERAPWALVHEGDFFQWAEATPERFECCAGNPPFIRYHHFSGAVRQRALALCSSLGANFSGLTSSWAPFLVAAAGLLKAGGRMAFVVPAEIGHAPYAAPLIEYLVANFSTVHVIAVREKLFPELSEDCWLLYTEGFGGCTSNIRFSALDRFEWSTRPPKHFLHVGIGEWRTVWNRRLRPFLLPAVARDAYVRAVSADETARLADFAKIGIGYVSGDNGFFHLRPSDAEYWNIPAQFLHPSVRNGRALPERQITRRTVQEWAKLDRQMLLLRLRRGEELPSSVKRYLDSDAGKAAREAYKCRNRAPWYAVPDVQIPDFVLTYMSGRSPQLVRNAAGVTCTNTVHSVRIRDSALAKTLMPSWGDPLVELSCELEGHPLGGGMLKLEVREASRVLFAASDFKLDRRDAIDVNSGLAEMRRWRHYAD
jgi:adenine-specific DNA-methyltransferase